MTGKDLILALRGEPTNCDFCEKPAKAEELEPEEAGCWVCHECMERWNEQEPTNAKFSS